MAYAVRITPSAARDLGKLSAELRVRVDRAISALGTRPRPHGSVKLAGAIDLYRVRVGDYRVIYRIEDRVVLVLVVRIGHRGDVYR